MKKVKENLKTVVTYATADTTNAEGFAAWTPGDATLLEQLSMTGEASAWGNRTDFREDAVADALSSLPSEQRTPLILSCVEGKSYEEIALILSLPPGTVKSRISRGRMALRKLLSDPPNGRNKMNSTPSKQMKGGASHDL